MSLPDPSTLHLARELLLARALAVLGGWAVLNLLTSGFLLLRTDRLNPAHHFHQMNVGWGFVNACLATWGVLHRYAAPAPALPDLLAQHFADENLFVFNAGLDVAYIMAGCWLVARAAAPTALHPARLLGFGHSLWVQGGFLLVFDAAVYFLLLPLGRQLLALVP